MQVVGLEEGSLGAAGRVLSITDITRMITQDYGDSTEATAAVAEPGTAIDPICGMTVDLEDAITADVDGTTYGFCSAVCRKVFVEEHAEAT